MRTELEEGVLLRENGTVSKAGVNLGSVETLNAHTLAVKIMLSKQSALATSFQCSTSLAPNSDFLFGSS